MGINHFVVVNECNILPDVGILSKIDLEPKSYTSYVVENCLKYL